MAHELTQIRDITLEHFNSKMAIIINEKNKTIEKLMKLEKIVVSFELKASQNIKTDIQINLAKNEDTDWSNPSYEELVL